ncbi:DUF7619 domain-containing protein [Cochleicola gelatinilyticus]|uniref:Uncharacterized protein n=1 Tax=Cochleicola gelatinilyticus TaxID=1763537 RepID=A0A167IGI0_9FLAO|nr:T9SS type A sorting domain-containing protein [Cochleicola gelatinilyticus]OAB79629.1 hypothetical protein ULVI_02415 [Cochleicola gelatinilyticus]
MFRFLLLSFFLFSYTFSIGQCPATPILLSSQAEVDAFSTTYPGCTEIQDFFTIEGADITDLSPLAVITGFGRGIQVTNNPMLQNLSGLENVVELGVSSGAFISIMNNAQLTSIAALNNMVVPIGNNNPPDIYIVDNPLLENLQGLDGVAGYTYTFEIRNNDSLVDLEGLESITGADDLNIEENDNLSSLNGTENFENVGFLMLNDNPQLANLDSLSPDFIQTIWIDNNDLLTNINSFEGNSTIRDIKLINNAQLTDISGVADAVLRIEPNVETLHIENNPMLEMCSVSSVCNYLSDGNPAIILNNAAGCNNEIEITADCIICPPGNIDFLTQAEINQFALDYPNCSIINGSIMIGSFAVTNNDIVDLSPLSSIERVENLNIAGNNALITLNGLENITTIDRNLKLVENPVLQDIAALQNLNLMGAPSTFDISFEDCPLINSLMEIFNPAVPLQVNYLILNDMHGLQNLNGLESINNVSYSIEIQRNDNLENLDGLSNVSGETVVLGLTNCPALTSISGLSGITTLTNDVNMEVPTAIVIRNCDALTNLNGLEGINTDLSSQLEFYEIKDNELLSDISALSQISFSSINTLHLSITDNPSLSQCNITSVCDVLSSGLPQQQIEIENNASGCTAVSEVEDACGLNVCPSQQITFTSQAQIDAFAATYPDCTELNVNAFILGEDITNLNGISQITVYNEILNISNTSITTLDGLDEVTAVNYILSIVGNDALIDLSGMGSLHTVGFLGIVENENLVSVSDFGVISEVILPLEGISITDNPSLETIEGFSNLTADVSMFISNNPSLTNLTGLENIEFLTGLTITDNSLLTDISALETIPFIPDVSVSVANNQNLSQCSISSICTALANNENVVIENNATGCNNTVEVAAGCTENFNSVTGTVLFDFNLNNCDAGDYPVANANIELTNGIVTYQTLTTADGMYSLFVPEEGTYAVSVLDASLPDDYTAMPVSETVVLSGSGNTEIVDFCASTSNVYNDLSISMIPLAEARPGFDSDYLLTYENLGTNIQSGEVNVQFNDARQSFLDAIPSETSSTPDMFTFQYEDLLPFEQRTITITMQNFPPPTNNAGDLLVFNAEVSPMANDANPEDNTTIFEQIIINSYDPNDKQVTQGTEILEEEVGDYLDYVVRFQNTGTASAINVVITDTLSNNLNWNTIRTLSASHDYRVEIVDGNAVSFIFEDINLPAEQDDPEGSNGYIAFKVRSSETLQLGDVVENTANIYFDFNEPIITNTVSTEVVAPLSVDEFSLEVAITIYPNPASEKLFIVTSEGVSVENIIVYSVVGAQVKTTSEATLDISNFSEGIYFVEITTNQGGVTKKIVKD